MSSLLGKNLEPQHGAAQVVLEERIEPTDHDSKRYNESAGKNVSKRDVEAEVKRFGVEKFGNRRHIQGSTDI